MKKLTDPKLLFFANTIPLFILFIIWFSQISIIESLLSNENIKYCIIFGTSLAVIGLTNFIYICYAIYKKQPISTSFCITALIVYISYIYIFYNNTGKLIPSSIPQWMLSSDIVLQVGTFLMPTLAYALFVLVVQISSKVVSQSIKTNLLLTFSTPILTYVFVLLILPLWQPLSSKYETHFIIIMIIIGILVFLFFLIRFFYFLSIKKTKKWKEMELIWKIPFCVLFPIIGLAFNNNGYGGIFGDFSNQWYYFIAIINGILVCIPNTNKKTNRLLIYIARCICFSYTFYFFLVFLPYLPLSIIAIILVGTGFLMLSPLILFIVHINELAQDYNFLKKSFSKNILRSISISSFFFIPIILTITYLNDKQVLNETLNYLYSPDYSKQYSINEKSLARTLSIVKKHRSSNNGFLSNKQTPYLSSYFTWLVLDNLTLSNSKINKIEQVFFNKKPTENTINNPRNKNVQISSISSRSSYDSKQNLWKSWIDLDIANCSNQRLLEYITTIELPEGCWISDYYLFVGDKKEKGILAEKKAATWLYSQIRNQNRDPGLLNYISGNKILFKVFPFSKNEVRYTGIELIHKEPISLLIDKHKINLGDKTKTKETILETEHAIYVPSSLKKTLPKISRTPYFHFLIDISNGKKENLDKYVDKIEFLKTNYPKLIKNAKIDFVNSNVYSSSFDKNWKEKFHSQNFKNGFYLDRALKKILVNSYNKNERTYPIIITITEDFDESILESDYADFKITFPENNVFYNIGSDKNIEAHSLLNNSKKGFKKGFINITNNEVLEYKSNNNKTIAYLNNNTKASIILKNNNINLNFNKIHQKEWNTALNIHAYTISQTLHPSVSNKKWLNLVRSSFKSKILTPVTSYIVVENEAQKAVLKKKQKEVLNGNKSLDLGDDIRRMSEPGLLIMLFLLLLLFTKTKLLKYSIKKII